MDPLGGLGQDGLHKREQGYLTGGGVRGAFMSDLPLCLSVNFQTLVPIRILIYRSIYQGPLFTAMLICDDYGILMGQGNGVKSPHLACLA